MEIPYPDAPPNFLSTFIQARRAGEQDRMAAARQNALAMANTDVEGAAQRLRGLGDFESANALDVQASRQRVRKAVQTFDPAKGDQQLSDARQSGDLDVYDAVSKLTADQRVLALDKAKRLGAVAYALKQVPYEGRKAALAQNAGQLQRDFNFTPEQIQSFDPTDEALSVQIGNAMTIAEQIAAADKASDNARQQATLDETIRHNKETERFPKYLVVPQGGSATQINPGADAPSVGPDPVAGITAALGGQPTFTSGLRSPEHNAEVGGVPNSHHLNGTARDLIPPQGMSIAEAARRLKATGQYAEVLDEGDHVHVAWAMPAAGRGPAVIQGPPKPSFRPATVEEKASVNIPADMPAQVSPDGEIKPIAVASKAQQQAEKMAEALQLEQTKAQTIIPLIQQTIKRIGFGESGLVGKTMSGVPGTKAYDVARQIETIKANLGFQQLQAMRQASPTGGALGAVSERELLALQATVANLDMGQSEDQQVANLKQVQQHYERWLDAVQKAAVQPAPSADAPRAGRDQLLSEARAAIKQGAPRDKVEARLKAKGVDPAGL